MSESFVVSTLTREEREILIRKSEAHDSFHLVTTSLVWKHRLEKLGCPLKKDLQTGWSCKLPENAITIRRFSAVNRTLSQEQKAKAAETLQRYRNLRGKLDDF